MLKRREVSAGKIYVNEEKQIARDVVEVVNPGQVKFNEYNLRNGRLMRGLHQVCRRDQMIRWADREATPQERTSLESDKATDIFVTAENEALPTEEVHETVKAQMLTETRHHTPTG